MLSPLQSLLNDLLADVETFMSREGMTDWQFGWQAVRDPNFVRRLRNGANMQVKTINRAYDFLRSQQQSVDAQ